MQGRGIFRVQEVEDGVLTSDTHRTFHGTGFTVLGVNTTYLVLGIVDEWIESREK